MSAPKKLRALTREDTLFVLFGVIDLEVKNESYPLKLKRVLKYNSLGSITQAFGFLKLAGLITKPRKIPKKRMKIYSVNWERLFETWEDELAEYYELTGPEKDALSEFFKSADNKKFLKRYLRIRATFSVTYGLVGLNLLEEFTKGFETALAMYFSSKASKSHARMKIHSSLVQLYRLFQENTLAGDVDIVAALDSLNLTDEDFDGFIRAWVGQQDTKKVKK